MNSRNPVMLVWGIWAVLAAVLIGLLLTRTWHVRPAVELSPVRVKPTATATRDTTSGLSVTTSKPHRLPTAQTYSIAPDGTVFVPTQFRLPGVNRVRTASSFKEWVAQFQPDEQAAIRTFSTHNYGIYKVNSAQQVAWMAMNGYPMPEDILAAQSLSDGDLRKLARNGNDKAAFLLRERNLEQLANIYAQYAADGKMSSDFWQSDPQAQQFSEDQDLYQQVENLSHSPFKGYVHALSSILASDSLSADADVFAGLNWASSLGDFRAAQFLDGFLQSDPERLRIREAMAIAVSASSSLLVQDKSRMRANGCAPVGVSPGMYIPGDFAPAE